MENTGKVCPICEKWFSCGKAIGGHMRSHFVMLPIPSKTEVESNNQALENSVDLTQHPIQSASSLACYPETKQTQNFQSMKRNFSANSNRENESVPYSKNPTHKRSKCYRKFNATADTNALSEQRSSTPEADSGAGAAIALCLMSRDWPRNKKIETHIIKMANKMKAKEREKRRGNSLAQADSEARFKCDRCPKMFPSYQALGGHKASHSRTKNQGQGGGHSVADNGMLKSTQALSGHMKVLDEEDRQILSNLQVLSDDALKSPKAIV